MGIKYFSNEQFFDTWTREMAYVLGYLYADGSLEDSPYIRGKYIRVTSVERGNIVRIRKLLNSDHTIVKEIPKLPNRNNRYLLRIGSHKLYNSLVNLGLYPNKSLTIRFPEVPVKFVSDFVRGYLDGDGCVNLYLAKGKKKKLIVKKLSVIFTSGSKKFLEEMCAELRRILDLKQQKVYINTRSFQLRYSTSDSIKMFKFLYRDNPKNLYLKRKVNVFKRYFSLRPIRIDKYVGNVLESLE